jgi:hypothetical protein
MIRYKQTSMAYAKTIHQAVTVVANANGKIEGKGEGRNAKKDDRIMAYALALWALRHRRIPREEERDPLAEEADRIRRIRERFDADS